MSVKIERLEQTIKKELSIILRHDLSDPRIAWVIITDVEVTNDLSFAKIFINFLPNEHTNEEIMDSLEKAKGFIRSKLAHQLTTRKVPQLIFEYDDSLDKGNRIDELLKNV